MRQKQITIAVVLGAAFGAPAFGADLSAPVYKAPVVAAPAPFSWNGFYVGGEVGGKWTDATWTTTPLQDINAIKSNDASSPRDFNPTGVRAGGYFGYNWQFAPRWVGGVEGDIAWADQTTTAAGVPGCSILCIPATPGPGNDLSSVKAGWDASARARLGFLVTPQVLLYGTGGVAWQFLQASGTCQHSGPDPFCEELPGNPFLTVSNSTVRTGWTVGGGIEAHIYGNWLLRAEYRFADFGTWNNTFNFTLPSQAPGADALQFRLKDTEQIATVGLAYKF